ncbi:MAG: hypothetical protein AAGH74_12640 [Pseudomonadota bacterium]
MQFDRREVLFGLACLAGLAARPGAASTEIVTDLSPLRIGFPQWVIRQESRSQARQRVLTLTLTATQAQIAFDTGAIWTAGRDLTAGQVTAENRGFASRKAMVLRRLASEVAFALEMNLTSLRAERQRSVIIQQEVAEQLAKLQAMEVLNALSPDQVGELVERLLHSDELNRFRWDAKRKEIMHG